MIIDYEKAAITDAGDEHRPRVYEMPARVKEMVARFEDLYESEEPELGAADGSFQTTFRVYLAPVGTGEKVLKKELHPIRDWLATVHANAMLVETEAAGACQQFYESQLLKDFRAAGLLIIRGISDHADFEKDDKWQLLCCLNAMRCLRAILCANPDFASER
jgi:hypothetical protein